jgi:hypothetical protein
LLRKNHIIGTHSVTLVSIVRFNDLMNFPMFTSMQYRQTGGASVGNANLQNQQLSFLTLFLRSFNF